MKRSILLLFACIICFKNAARVTTLITPRSVSDSIARYLLGWEFLIDRQRNYSYGILNINPEVMQSFRQEHLAQAFFGDIINERTASFVVSGSLTKERNARDWIADYFGLPPDFISHVRVRPTVTNAVIDVGAYVAFHDQLPGAYLYIHGPVTYTRWDLNLCETIIQTGTQSYTAGYFTPQEIPRTQLRQSFSQYLCGNQLTIENLTFEPLCAARASGKTLRRVLAADIQLFLGYDIWATNRYHFSPFLLFGIPAGNRPEGIYLFEPIIGNGHHVQIGIGCTGHLRLDCFNTNEEVVLIGGFTLSHLCSTKQRRVFDLCRKPVSRYMLAENMSATITDNLVADTPDGIITPAYQFSGTVAPIANLTLSTVNVQIPWQFDSALIVCYRKGCRTWSFGYGVFARAAENVNRVCNARIDDQNVSWALKGDAQLFGFYPPTSEAVALSATMSRATLTHAGNVRCSLGTTTTYNPLIDSPNIASASPDGMGFATLTIAPTDITPINTTTRPVLIKPSDIDLKSATTHITCQKIFGQLSQIFFDECDVIPYISLGAEVDIGPNHDPTPPNCANNVVNGAISSWGLWLKVGAKFE